MPRRGFDFTGHMQRLCAAITARVPELSHVDAHRIAYSFSQARKRVRHGMWASLTPMRFAGGRLVEMRHGRRYTFQRLYDASGQEMLYILNFYLPRFLDLPFRDKLVTVFHELWHISPAFDGDLRRHPGRCYAHTRSQKDYDAAMERLAQRWLDLAPPEDLHGFLRCGAGELWRTHGGIYGTRIRHPKIIRID